MFLGSHALTWLDCLALLRMPPAVSLLFLLFLLFFLLLHLFIHLLLLHGRQAMREVQAWGHEPAPLSEGDEDVTRAHKATVTIQPRSDVNENGSEVIENTGAHSPALSLSVTPRPRIMTPQPFCLSRLQLESGTCALPSLLQSLGGVFWCSLWVQLSSLFCCVPVNTTAQTCVLHVWSKCALASLIRSVA